MANLKFINVNKIYDNNVQAVFDFNLEVKDKEFIVFVGPSGCGKSTTLRMLAGLEDITSGELYIDGKLVNYVPPMNRHIAMVFQSYALYPHMSVYQNMSFGLRIRKATRGVFSYDDEAKALLGQSAKLRKEYKKVSKKLSKSPNDDECLKKEEELRFSLIKLYEEIFSKRKEVIGIDSNLIKRKEKEIKKLESGLLRVNKLIEKEEKKGDADKNNLLLDTMNRDLEYKQNQIKSISEEISYLKNNEVQILKSRNYSVFERDYQVLKAAGTLDLFKYLSRKPAELSGGQRQRVALGRAIVRNPKVFLMDEPLSNLDAKLRVQTRTEIASIHKKVGATTIYVTHDQTEAMTLADRIVIMKDGYIQQIATPKQAYNEPENMFVGGFIGSPAMNFLLGTYSNGKFVFDGEKCISINLDKKHIDLLKNDYEGKHIALGVRPENIKLSSLSDNYSLPIEADIKDSELLGNEYIYYCYLEKQKFLVKLDIDNEIANTSKAQLFFNLDKVHFFDLETTKRIK